MSCLGRAWWTDADRPRPGGHLYVPQAIFDILLDLEPTVLDAFPKLKAANAAFAANAAVAGLLGANQPAYLQRQ